ncbi:hypothetical protein ACIGFK_03315 [Streptomyces sp. NPDC085524]
MGPGRPDSSGHTAAAVAFTTSGARYPTDLAAGVVIGSSAPA